MGDPWDINGLSDAYGYNEAQRQRIAAITGLPLVAPKANPLDGPALPGGAGPIGPPTMIGDQQLPNITPGRHEATGPGALAIDLETPKAFASDAVPDYGKGPAAPPQMTLTGEGKWKRPDGMMLDPDPSKWKRPDGFVPDKPTEKDGEKHGGGGADLAQVRALQSQESPGGIPTIQLPGAQQKGGQGLSMSAARALVERNQGDWNVRPEQWAKQGEAAVNESAAQLALRKREEQLGAIHVAGAEQQAEAARGFRIQEETQAKEQRSRERQMFEQVQGVQEELRKGPPAMDDASKAFSMMAVAFSGLGDMFKAKAGIQSNGAQQALQMVNQKAESDRAAWMQQKKTSLGAAQDSYSFARQMGMDDAAALAASKTHYIDQISKEMDVRAQRAGNDVASAKMDSLMATFEKAKQDAAVDAAKQQGSQISQLQMASQRAAAPAKNDALKSLMSDKRQDELMGRAVNLGGKTFLVPSGEEGKTIRQQAGATNKLVGIINEMDGVVGKYGWQDVLAGKATMKTEDRAKLDSLAGQAAVAFGQSNHLGTFDEGMERLSKNIQGDPNAFTNNLASNLATFKNTQKNAYRWTMQALPLQQAHRVNVVDETGVPRAAVVPGEWTHDSAVMDQPSVKPK